MRSLPSTLWHVVVLVSCLCYCLGAALPVRAQDQAYGVLSASDPGGPVFAWADLSKEPQVAANVLGFGAVQFSEAIEIGFPFEFYGRERESLYIGSHGMIIFDFLHFRSHFPAQCSDFSFRGLACPFGGSRVAEGEDEPAVTPRDYNPSCSNFPGTEAIYASGTLAYRPFESGQIRILRRGTPGDREFIVEFLTVGNPDRPSPAADAQVILREGTNEIVIQYLNVDADPGTPFFTAVRDHNARHHVKARDCASMTVADTMAFSFLPEEAIEFRSATDRVYGEASASQPMEPVLVTQTPGRQRITQANGLKLSHALGGEFRWSTGDSVPGFGGSAAAKVAAAGFADDGKTFLIDVLEDFVDGDSFELDGLRVLYSPLGGGGGGDRGGFFSEPVISALFLDGGAWGRVDTNHSLHGPPAPYFFRDNVSGYGGVDFAWEDMTGAAEFLPTHAFDALTTDIGFSFTFYGQERSTVDLFPYGILEFPVAAPEVGEDRGGFSCACDLCGRGMGFHPQGPVVDKATRVLVKTAGEPGARRFIAEFRGIRRDLFDPITFEHLGVQPSHDVQAILEEATGVLRLQFDNVDETQGPRDDFGIGINEPSPDARLHLIYLACRAASVRSGLAIEFHPIPTPTLDSGADQVFSAFDDPQEAFPFTITEHAAATTIFAGASLDVIIPDNHPMVWSTSDFDVALSGTAASRVAPGVTYPNQRTLRLEVLDNFAPGETLIVSGATLEGFTDVSPLRRFTLAYGGPVTVFDARGKRVEYPTQMPTISSGANQTLLRGGGVQNAFPVLVTSSTPSSLLKSGTTLRIRVPFPMANTSRWDTTNTMLSYSGSASGKLSPTVSYPNIDVVELQIIEDFLPGESVSIDTLRFTNPTTEKSEGRLQLTHNLGSVFDDFTKAVGRAGEYGSSSQGGNVLNCSGTGGSSFAVIDVFGALPVTSALLHVQVSSFTGIGQGYEVYFNDELVGEIPRSRGGSPTYFFAVEPVSLVQAGSDNLVEVRPFGGANCPFIGSAGIIVDAGPAGLPTINTAVPNLSPVQIGRVFQVATSCGFPFLRQAPFLELSILTPDGASVGSASQNIGASFGTRNSTFNISVDRFAEGLESGTYTLRLVLRPEFGTPYVDDVLEVPLIVNDGPFFQSGSSFFSPSSVENDGFISTMLRSRVIDYNADGLTMTADMSALGGLAEQPLFDDGTNGDFTAGDLFFTLGSITTEAEEGPYSVLLTVRDAADQSATQSVPLTVTLGLTPRVRVARFVPAIVSNDGTYPTLLEARVTDREGQEDIVSVLADLTAIGGPAAQPLNDLGVDGDLVAGDTFFSFGPLSTAVAPDTYQIPVTARDASNRTHSVNAQLVVIVNGAPTADAGDDFMVAEEAVGILDGSGSSDPDDEVLTFLWTQLAGTPVIIQDPAAETTSFTAPNLLANEVLRFRLRVTDQLDLISDDEVEATVLADDDPPFFTEGPSTSKPSLTRGQTASLSAVATPPDLGDAVSITWEVVSGGGELLQTAGSPVTFQAPAEIPADETATIRATARDNANQTAFADVEVLLATLPDLELLETAIPTEWRIGQLLEVPFHVRNNGPGAASTAWQDCVLLSEDDQIGGDVPVACSPRPVALAAGAEYQRVVALTVPPGDTGQRWVVLRTDGATQLDEEDEENNARIFGPITLLPSPCPDLAPEAVALTGTEFRAGGVLGIDFAVRNIGNSPSNAVVWQDAVWLSSNQDPSLGSGFKLHIGSFPNPSALAPGQAYSRSLEPVIPPTTQGEFFVMVRTDNATSMAECDEDNNVAFAPTPVTILPFQPPSLVPVDISVVPSNPFRGESVEVTWSIRNEGFLPTGPVEFFHRISARRDGSTVKRTLANGVVPQAVSLAAGQTIGPFSTTVEIPFTVWQETTILVQAFAQQGGVLSTPERGTQIVIQTGVPADLEVVSVAVSPSAISGQAVAYSYEVRNESFSPTGTTDWKDAILLSRDADFDTTHDQVLLGFRQRFGELAAQESYSFESDIFIPHDADGTYRLIFFTDVEDAVFEGDFEDNNWRASAAFNVDFRPPDIRPINPRLELPGGAPLPAIVLSGQPLVLRYEIENIGTGTASGSWTIGHALAAEEGGFRQLAYTGFTGSIPPGGSESRSLSFQVPFDFESLDAFVSVGLDVNSDLFESDNSNNGAQTDSFGVELSPPDLVPGSGPMLEQGSAPGERITAEWRVRNAAGPVGEIAWQDRLYLSLDESLEPASDALLAVRANSLAMPHNAQTMQSAEDVPVPPGLSGEYFALVQIDAGQQVAEVDESNNVATLGKIRVGDFCFSDLAAVEVDVPETAVTGQKVPIAWRVRNVGSVDTSVNSWSDRLYLSRDQFLDPAQDVFLGAFPRSEGLDPAEEYLREAEVLIPAGLAGPYYVFVQVDALGDLCELSKVNNIGHDFTAMDVLLLPPTDFVVDSVDTPSTTTIGQEVVLRWTVRNILEPTHGSWIDSVYLSKDGTWDLSDFLVGQVTRNFAQSSPLAAGATYQGELTAAVPGLTPGEYRVLVRSDARNNVIETDDSNNDLASAPFAIEATRLELGVPFDDVLPLRGERFYHVRAPFNGLTLAVDLRTSNTLSANEVFVSAFQMPTRTSHDFRSRDILGAEHVVIVPSTSEGDYYIYVRNDARIGGGEGIRILVETREFGMEGVSPQIIGNAGEATLTIDGTRFNAFTAVALAPTGTRGIDGAIHPTWVKLEASEVHATFDLTGVPAGLYDMVAFSESDMIDVDLRTGEVLLIPTVHGVDSLVAAVRVIDGGGPDVRARVFSPSAAQALSGFSFVVDITNNGLNDAPSPLVEVSSPSGAPLGVERGSVNDGGLLLATRGPGERRDRFAPGESVQIALHATASGASPAILAARVTTTTDDLIEWGPLEADYRDSRPEPDWLAAWAALQDQFPTHALLHESARAEAALLPSGSLALDVSQYLLALLAEPPLPLREHVVSVPSVEEYLASARGFNPPPEAGCESCNSDWLVFFGGLLHLPALTALAGACSVVDGPAVGESIFHFIGAAGFIKGTPIIHGASSNLAREVLENGQTEVFHRLVIRELSDRIISRALAEGRDCGEVWTIPVEDLHPEPHRILFERGGITGLDYSGVRGEATRILGNTGVNDFRVTGDVELTKRCLLDSCALELQVRFRLNLEVMDLFDFCPGSGLTGLQGDESFLDRTTIQFTNTVITMLKQLEVCGVGQEFLSIVSTPWLKNGSFPIVYLDPEETGAADASTPPCVRRHRRLPGTCPINGRASCDPDDEAETAIFASSDPNEIQGPAGFGPEHFVAAPDTLDFRILFENMEEATAPAQFVRIELPIDPSLDLRRFQLGEMGFGDVTIPVPAGRSFHQATLDFTEQRGFLLRVTASASTESRLAVWTFQTLDPATGEPPANPLLGFLPPNATPPEGDGFVTYSIRAHPSTLTGAVVASQALIFFDLNEPIETNIHTATIDAAPPESTAFIDAPPTDGGPAEIRWTSSDDEGGSGVRDTTLYVSTEGGPFVVLGTFDQGTTTTLFDPAPGVSYAFHTTARDNAGNQEATPLAPDVMLLVLRPARAGFSPPQIDFGRVATNDTVRPVLTLAVSNLGDEPLFFGTPPLQILGTDAGDFEFVTRLTQDEVPGGGDRLVQISFHPGATGAREAVVRVLTSDAENGVVDIPLLGEGFFLDTSYWILE